MIRLPNHTPIPVSDSFYHFSYGWLSEETADDPARLDKSRLFVVDPIDGTVAFLKGKPWWAVSVAVVENGKPVAGVVFAPELDETFTATAGGGAFLNSAVITASAQDRVEDCRMLGDAPMFKHPAWREPWPPMHIEQGTEARGAAAARGRGSAPGATRPQ
eukprot:gene30539-40581_t